MNNCLSCRHAYPAVGPGGRIDFSQKICRESPPVPLVIGVGPQGPMVQPFFPIVNKDCICDRFDEKLPGETAAAPETTQ